MKASLLTNIFLLFSCLQLFSLKSKYVVQYEKTLVMADPFVPLLTEFVVNCNDITVVILSLSCLGFFLRMNLPLVPLFAKSLGLYILKLLIDASPSSNSINEISQS